MSQDEIKHIYLLNTINRIKRKTTKTKKTASLHALSDRSVSESTFDLGN